MNKDTKIKGISLLFGILLVAGLIGAPLKVQAASNKKKALQAYANVLKGETIEWGSSTTSLEGSSFGLAYVNNDNIPELVVYAAHTSHAEGYVSLYAYKNGKVKQIRTMMDDFAYYPKKNLVEAIHSGTGGYERYYFIISGLKAKNYLHKVSEKESGWDMNGDGKLSVFYTKYTSTTKFVGKSISKKKFNTLLKKKVGSTKIKKVKVYQNSPRNRKKVLKS